MPIAQQRFDQIRNLVNQWEQMAGFTVTVPDWMIWEMAGNVTSAGYVTSLFDVGQYMYQHAAIPSSSPYHLSWDQGGNMPWAFYGMSAPEYDSKVQDFNSTFQRLTGQNVPQNLIDQALRQNGGTMTGSQFQNYLLTQTALKNQYGWLKYGLDFEQFQQQKVQMLTQFGHELTDEQAVAQLQALHAASGSNVSAALQPTLTQVEKKAAQTGINTSVVR